MRGDQAICLTSYPEPVAAASQRYSELATRIPFPSMTDDSRCKILQDLRLFIPHASISTF
jgi:hypothetical protein